MEFGEDERGRSSMGVVSVEGKNSDVTYVKMQYNHNSDTVGRDRKGSVSSVHGVASWFSSLRRTPKKNKHANKASFTSRSEWDISSIRPGKEPAVRSLIVSDLSSYEAKQKHI